MSGDEVTSVARNRALGKLIGVIGELLDRWEREFTLVGRNLDKFSKQSTKISQMAQSASGIMGGEEIKGSITMIREMVDLADRLLGDADGKAGENLAELERILELLKEVGQDLASLRETAKTLRMLGLSTKVHSTRAGSETGVFMSLGQEISDLSGVISSRSLGIVSQVRDLISLVEGIQDSVRELRKNQRLKASLVIDRARAVLGSLENLAVKSRREAQDISERSRQISANIGEVVVALQYQDIISQDLHTVRTEMERIVARAGGNQAEDGSGKSNWARDQVAAARKNALQSGIVEKSGNLLQDSVNRVIGNLTDISGSIEDMTVLTSRVSGDSSLFLRDLEASVSSVTTYLSEVLESSREMSEAMNSLAGTVEGMNPFINEIQDMSSEIELIALNARVRTAHTESEGIGMGVIAGSIQRMAVESTNHRESILERLNGLADAADSLRSEVEQSTSGGEKKLDQMVREIGVLLDSLRHIQEKVVGLLQGIESDGRTLLNSIWTTLRGISVHTLADSTLKGVAEELEKMAGGILEVVSREEISRVGGEEMLMVLSGRDVSEQARFLRTLNIDGSDMAEDNQGVGTDAGGEVELF